MPGIGNIINDANAIEKGFKGNSQVSIEDQVKADIEAQKKRNAEKANGGNPSAQGAQGAGDAGGGGGDMELPMNETARNTSKLVKLQEEQLDFQRALIGGGQIAQKAFSGLEVAKVTGGMSPIHQAAIRFADEINDIMGKNQLRAIRTYGYR